MSLADRLKSRGIVAAVTKIRRPSGGARSAVTPSTLKGTVDMRRIIGLPVDLGMSDAESASMRKELTIASAAEGGFKLWLRQLEIVRAYRKLGGVVGPLGVGEGKTIATLLCAQVGYHERGHKRIALMVPPSLVPKTIEDLRIARRSIVFEVPFTNLHGKNKRARMIEAKSSRVGLFLLPYSLLQTSDGYDLLDELKITLYVMDEAHKLKNVDAASTNRWLKCVDKHRAAGANIEFVALSGTLTTRGLKDYYHLMIRALGEKSPIPLNWSESKDWDLAIDVTAESDPQAGYLTPLVDWARKTFPDVPLTRDRSGFREAFKLRSKSSPGVVASDKVEVGTSLAIDFVDITIPKDEDGDALQEHMDTLEECMITPMGEELAHYILAWKWRYELSAGIYNKLIWPTVGQLALSRNIPTTQAQDLLERAKLHHDYHMAYMGLLKVWFADFSEPGLDTPFTVGQHMSQHGSVKVGEQLYKKWKKMKDADFEDRPKRISIPVRVCDYKVKAAVAWALKHPGCILWVFHNAMRVWIVEELRNVGFKGRVINGKSGDAQVAKDILDTEANKKRNEKAILVLQSRGYHQGHNLQYLKHQLFVQVPRQADIAEQCIGRLHRPGQQEDEITVHFLMSSEADKLAFGACACGSLYVHETMQQQRLIFGDYLTHPPFADYAVLRKQVPHIQSLSAAQQLKFKELFVAR